MSASPVASVQCASCNNVFDGSDALAQGRRPVCPVCGTRVAGSPSAAARSAAVAGGRLMLGCVLGGVAALVGALAWFAIALWANAEIGILAWGIGLAVGAAMSFGVRRGTVLTGALAAVISLAGIFVGKALFVIGMILSMTDDAGLKSDTPREQLASAIALDRIDPNEFEGLSEEEAGKRFQQRVDQELSKANEELKTKSDEEIETMLKAAEAESESEPGPTIVDFVSMVAQATIGPMDLLFAALAVITAYRLGSRDLDAAT